MRLASLPRFLHLPINSASRAGLMPPFLMVMMLSGSDTNAANERSPGWLRRGLLEQTISCLVRYIVLQT
jgi:hypothetical protein